MSFHVGDLVRYRGSSVIYRIKSITSDPNLPDMITIESAVESDENNGFCICYKESLSKLDSTKEICSDTL